MKLFADATETLHVSVGSVLPFVVLLLGIALLPILAEKWWHNNLRKALVSIALALPVAIYLLYLQWHEGQPGWVKLEHALREYVDFIALLAALYTVAGGIAVRGELRPTPAVNIGVLALGAVLANIIGTTGASMLLLRPLLRINRVRQQRGHLPVFFIFLVGNLGGLLTPLGDPPLFLGFLGGVEFTWTLAMWPHWLVVNGSVLAIAFAWDWRAFRREPDPAQFPQRHGALSLAGGVNFIFLAGIIAAVLLQAPALLGQYGFTSPWPSLVMAALALLSWRTTPRSARVENQFSWAGILEVAVLFLGIFVTMTPALALLGQHRPALGLSEPWQLFWLTGILSSWLDNAPTYMTFAALAADGADLGPLARNDPLILQAISAGAVFMGALTYIGNGPNFMVKSMAESMGYPMPSFFAYWLWASAILLPVFVLATWLFFWPS